MPYCPKCGAPATEGAAFCTTCGYALTGTSVSAGPRENLAPVNSEIAEYLMSDEQLLFWTEKAELKAQGSNSVPLIGPLAITDRRLFVASKRPKVIHKMYYDSTYARQFAAAARERNLQAKASKTSNGRVEYLPLLTGAELKKGLVGGPYLSLSTHVVDFSAMRQKMFSNWLVKTFVAKEVTRYNLRILKPLTLGAKLGLAGLFVSGPAGLWLTPIVGHFKEKANVTYEPILEIFQAKANELAGLVKEIDSMAV